MKTAILYSNPLALILNPKGKKGKINSQGGEKQMAKKSRKSLGKHVRPSGYRAGTGIYIPMHSRLMPHHAGHIINPMTGEHHWGNIAWLGAGALVGVYGQNVVPNLLNRASFFSTRSPYYAKSASVVLISGAGYAVSEYGKMHTLGAGLAAGAVADFIVDVIKDKAPSLMLVPSTVVTAPAETAAATPATTKTTPAAPATSGLTVIQGGLHGMTALNEGSNPVDSLAGLNIGDYDEDMAIPM